MKSYVIIGLILFWPTIFVGQNKINNGTFEDTLHGNWGLIKAKYWNSPSQGSPDFFHVNSGVNSSIPSNLLGYQNAKKSNGYYGFATYSVNRPKKREFIQNELTDTLIKDSTYCFQAYISLADSSTYAAKQLFGVHFSSNKLNYNIDTALPIIPEVELNDTAFFSNKTDWVSVQMTYIAKGGEKYITIGNFLEDKEMDTLKIVGGAASFYRNIYYYIDDVYLGHCDSVPIDTLVTITENKLYSHLNLYPNPVIEQFILENNSKEKLEFQLHNLLGQPIDVDVNQSGNRYEFAMGHLPKGIYLLKVSDGIRQNTFKVLKQ